MSVIDDLLRNNAEYAAGFDRGHLEAPPTLKLAILTCMDARMDVLKILGLTDGQAHVIRNAGGLATDDAIRSLVISHRVLGTEEVIVVQHTGCGMLGFDEQAMRDRLEEETGEAPSFEFGAIPDLEQGLTSAISSVRESPFLNFKSVRGLIYDVQSGCLEEVRVLEGGSDGNKMSTSRYADKSLWLSDVATELVPRPALGGDLQVDVAIVGAGYTGLWAAYYLLKENPALRIAILEKEIAGFGASGRNGGWCSALFAAAPHKIAKRYGRDRAIAMQRAMFETVDEVGRVCDLEGIEVDFHKGGTLTLALSAAHEERVRADLDEARHWGFSETDARWLSVDELTPRLRPADARGAAFTPHCARLHPARLARGLAMKVEKLGATIFEGTPALSIEGRNVLTPYGTVRADVVIQATEGYTARLPKSRRRLLPLYSLMIATEPLPPEVWDEIGWDGMETVHDGRHLLIYAQRTADNRIAIGGRGAPYHFGSRIKDGYDREPEVFESLKKVLTQVFPATRDARITHSWGGCLGVPRDWFTSVGYDKKDGLAWAGGYAGDGVSTTNLAGRTLRDLILHRDSELLKLPWVNHRSRSWEPEPFRWTGVNLGLKAMAHADDVEARTGKASRRGKFVRRLIGM